MLLSIFPDVDIVLELAGVDLGHRTFTHSIIIWLGIGGTVIFVISLKSRRGSEAAIYLIAYMSHLVIGDILVEHINVLYPIGDFIIDSTIRSSSLQHISLEAVLIGLMAAVVIIKFKHREKEMSLFSYHGTADSFLYLLLVLAMFISAIYILSEFRLSLVDVLMLVTLHCAAIATIILLWIESRVQRKQRLNPVR
jgi:membrane-bound metal-dependent hydrolase YbcI (DUF457 family)